MKKMLVILLILFTNVLAESNEDNYVDLLPDEEKQQFLDNVARRILKDVESKENVTGARSGEVSDDQLKQHDEYVKSIIKEEQRNSENEGDVNDKISKSASEEENSFGVQPLGTEKTSLQDEGLSNENSSNNTRVEDVTDNAPIIKRSVKDNNASEIVQSGENSETLQTVSQYNITSKETNELEADNEKFESESHGSGANISVDNVLNAIGSTTASHEGDKAVTVQSNQTDDARNVSVKAIHESRRTNNEDNTATSTVEITETTPDDNTNVNVTADELTTISYTFKSSSFKSNTAESTTLDGIFFESTTELTKTENDAESQLKSKNGTTKDSENEETTQSIPEIIESVTETTEPVHETTEPVPETTEYTKETTESVTETTELIPESTESVTETTKPVTETTKSVIETTKPVPESKTETEIVTTEATTEYTSSPFTTQRIPVATTEKTNIIVEDFTSTPTSATTVKSKILKLKTTTEKENRVSKKQIVSSKEITTAAIDSDEDSIETTTKKIRHKVIVHKPVKYILGPKAKKLAEAKNDVAQNNNFFELENFYYGNNLQHKEGKEYNVFEIPADRSPFTKEKAPIADQPYYVPVYNYAPNNAYFNPQNRLGPNADDSSAEKHAFQTIFNDDGDDNLDKTETLNVNIEYDRIYDNERKRFGTKQKTHSIHKQPTKLTYKSFDNVNPEDYLDSDYYFGRVRKAIARKVSSSKFPNSNEADHPANSIREGSLKDHIRAVRNILFRQKSFGLLSKDKYGGSFERTLRKGSERHEEKDLDKYTGRKRSINKHKQKVRYLRKHNQTKKIYVIDDFLTGAKERNEVVAFLTKNKNIHKVGKSRNYNKRFKKYLINLKETMKAKSDQDDIPVNTNEENDTKNLKLSPKNDVIKVSDYLQVLKDMVALDNKALVQFDWLGTTVDIQAALQQLFELIALVSDDVSNVSYIHPSDKEILKYVIFIHKLASEITEANKFSAKLKKKLVLPRNKKNKLKPRLMKENGLIKKVWLHLRKEVPGVNEYGALKQLNSFLIAVEDGLYDLHDAIKNVAKITKYKDQHWYQNLKDLYIINDDKHVLQLLLHMTSLRLFTLIEESAKNGLEDNYVQYMKKNRQHSKRTLEEMMFLLKILEEYNKYVE